MDHALPAEINYASNTAKPHRIRFATLTLFLALLPIIAVVFAFVDPLPNPGRGEPVAGIFCALTFLSAPPNLALSISLCFFYRRQTNPLLVCLLSALLATLASAVFIFYAYAIFVHGIC